MDLFGKYQKVKTDEEFKQRIKMRMRNMVVLIIAGILILLVGILAEFYWEVDAESKLLGFYAGVGSGLAGAGTVLFFKFRSMLKDEKKIRQARIEATDERNVAINTKASNIALIVLLIGMYLIILVGGLWNYAIVLVMGSLVALYLVSWLIARAVISRKM